VQGGVNRKGTIIQRRPAVLCCGKLLYSSANPQINCWNRLQATLSECPGFCSSSRSIVLESSYRRSPLSIVFVAIVLGLVGALSLDVSWLLASGVYRQLCSPGYTRNSLLVASSLGARLGWAIS
jgi:hypothetical protein